MNLEWSRFLAEGVGAGQDSRSLDIGINNVEIQRPAGLLLLLTVIAGCASQPSIDVFVTRLAPAQSTVLEQRSRIDLRLQNLGGEALNARGLAVQLELNGARFAQGVSDEPFEVPPLGEATTSVILSTSLFDVIRQLLRLESNASFAYRLTGQVHAAGGKRHRFSRAGEFSREQLQSLGRSRREG